MSISSQIAAGFRAIRAAVTEKAVAVRFGGKTYLGTYTSMVYAADASSIGPIRSAAIAVRLLCAELSQPHPKGGDDIAVSEPHNAGTFVARTVLSATLGEAGCFLHLAIGAKDSV